MKFFIKIFSYVKKYIFLFILSFIFAIILVFGKIAGVLKIGNFFSETFIGKNFQNVNLYTVLILLLIAFLWALSHYLVFYFSNILSANIIHDIRRDMYEKLINIPLNFFKKNKTGEIISRITNDLNVIEIFFSQVIIHLIDQPLTILIIITIMFKMSFKISIYFFSIVPLLGVALFLIGNLVQYLSSKVQINISNVTSKFQETIYGIEIIKGYNVEEKFKYDFNIFNDNHLKYSKKEIKFRHLGTPVAEFLGVTGVIIILVLGAFSVKNGLATSEEIVNFIVLALVLSEPLGLASGIIMNIKKLIPASERVFEIIEWKEKESYDKTDFGEISGKIQLKNLYFSYDNNIDVLKNINLEIEKNETIAIVGHSGAGKSTLISLLMMFYKPTKGFIYIDDKDIWNYNPYSIRKQVSIVSQDVILFSGSIFDNICLSKIDATLEEVIEACKIANAHNFISKLTDGYNTIIGDRGVRLSGGEKQRIALARALLRKPKILIFDEATSSLDAESEFLIQNSLEKIYGQQTTIIITHKLNTITHADKIVVIENGEIIEIGNHNELINKDGIYKKLLNLQLSI